MPQFFEWVKDVCVPFQSVRVVNVQWNGGGISGPWYTILYVCRGANRMCWIPPSSMLSNTRWGWVYEWTRT